MADIRLNFNWAIDEDGSLSVSVSPSSNDGIELGSFNLDQELLFEALEDDVQDYTVGGNRAALIDWEHLASFLTAAADHINARVNETYGDTLKKKAFGMGFERLLDEH